MARTKVTDAPKPEAPPPVALLRVEERNERVDITPEQKVERMNVAAGMFHEANSLFDEASELADSAKNTKKSAEAKRAEAERVLFDAQSGTMLRPYPVIVERHPTRPAEMMVWRVADGLDASELLQVETAMEGKLSEEEHIAAREAQGCTLLESRAMSPDEMAVAQAEDHARANPSLPGVDLEPPAATDGEEGAGESGEDGGDGEEDDLDGDDDGEDDEDGEAQDAASGDAADEQDAAADHNGEGAPAARARKGKAASPNVIARVRIALNGLTAGATYSMPELTERTDHHPDDIKLAIEQLVEEGFAVKTGKARGTRYGKAAASEEPTGDGAEAAVEVETL